ncbi:MAG: GNAT family N-acetyltransferase [Pseudomonadota bacterium]
MDIRSLKREDYEDWLPLWNANCLNQMSNEVTQETWRRLCNPKEQVFSLAAFEDKKLCGIMHYILHPTTGYKEPACYMQDLFVAEYCRRKGIAKNLVHALHDLGKKHQWARIYWFSDNSNEAVQNLYKNLGIHMNFSLHMLPTRD